MRGRGEATGELRAGTAPAGGRPARGNVRAGLALGLALAIGVAPRAQAQDPLPAPTSPAPQAEAPHPRGLPALVEALIQPSYGWDVLGPRLTFVQGAHLLDDSLTARTLEQALAAAPAAAALAHSAHRRLSLGHTLYDAGLSAVLVGVVGVAVGATQLTDSGLQVGLGTAGGVLILAGVVSTVLGAVGIHDGLADALEAANVYNLALVRGR